MEPAMRRKVWTVAVVLSGLVLLSVGLVVLLLSGGLGKLDASKVRAGEGVAAYLGDPPDRAAFEKAVMGRSTREITEMLGAPDRVLNERNLAWEYRYEKAAKVLLYIRDDHVVRIEW